MNPDTLSLESREDLELESEQRAAAGAHYAPLSDRTKYLAELAPYFGRAKDEPLWPDELRRAADAMEPDERDRALELAEAYERYNRLLWKGGFLDFGDLLALTLRV